MLCHVGRMSIPLFLRFKRVVVKPNFYLNEHLEKNHFQYCRCLFAISHEQA
ncbi:MAG: hypothetical protein ACYYK0_06315 [Candidatus Eutrophobiaceae bacterium]